MTIKEQFELAVAQVKTLIKRPTNEELLQLYALYKQATDGNVAGSRPGLFDIKERAKYDAWAALKGQTTDDAMRSYITLVANLLQRYQ